MCNFAKQKTDKMKNRMANVVAVALMMLAFASCGKKPDGKAEPEQPKIDTIPTLIMQAQRCSRLYTTEYHIHKVITHDDRLALKGKLLGHDYNMALPLGKRKIAIPVDATVKAYIDFADFSERNVRRDTSHIEIVLPDPHIVLSATRVNHDDIKEYVALMRRNFSDAELSSYERQGRDAIIADIAKTDILESARSGAANVLVPMLLQLGYKAENITITFRRDLRSGDITKLVTGG